MTRQDNADQTLASIDQVLSFYSAGLGEELTVAMEAKPDYPTGTATGPDPQEWADDEAIARAVPAGRLEDLTPRQMRRWVWIQTPEWQASLAEQLDEIAAHGAAAVVREIAAEKQAQDL